MDYKMIYQIVNKLNGDDYIGYTSFNTKKRFAKHCSNARSGHITNLYDAMRDFGIDNFDISVLQEDGTLDDEKLWIAKLEPTYNMTKGGQGGDTSDSPKFKRSMKSYHQNKPRKEYATNGFKNKKHSEQSRALMSNTRTQYWNNLSENEKKERGKKITGSNNGMFGQVPKNSVQVEVNGVLYNSKSAATKALNKSWYYIMKECDIKYVK